MTIRVLVNILTVALAISFFDGMFGFGLSENAYIMLGVVDVAVISRLCFMVNK